MKGRIYYIKGHVESEKQSRESLESFLRFDWDVELTEGVTPETLDKNDFDVPLIQGGRLESFKKEGKRTFEIKKSCFTNHLKLWKEVVDTNTPMAFIEQDSIACDSFELNFKDVIVLNIDYAFSLPSVLGNHPHLAGYRPPVTLTPLPLPQSYPLRYYKNNIYAGYNMMPGTAAYAITPKAASRLLTATYINGIDQSDFFINTRNVNIEYITPSPVKFNTVNLNTSHAKEEL
jgi:GR25 family glycosyltransferase involved in LPS biosynthesis